MKRLLLKTSLYGTAMTQGVPRIWYAVCLRDCPTGLKWPQNARLLVISDTWGLTTHLFGCA